METKTVNTELWKFEDSSNDIDVLLFTDTSLGLPSFVSLDSTYMKAYRDTEKRKQDAELIVTAVNACKAINPDNPLAVAKVLPEIIKFLKTLDESITSPYDANYMGSSLAYDLENLLNKATE